MAKVFEKYSFGSILGKNDSRCQFLNILTKLGLWQFLNNQMIYHHAKNQKKLRTHSWEKPQIDGRTDGQRENADFTGSSVGWESN